MLGSAPPVDIRHPPADLDALIEWFDRVAYRLVLLEEYPLSDVEAAVAAIDRGVRAHLDADRPGGILPEASAGTEGSGWQSARLGDDHERYRTSLEQLRWFLAVVQKEDHGGHRQALGQYARLVAESLRRHRAEEEGRGGGARKP